MGISSAQRRGDIANAKRNAFAERGTLGRTQLFTTNILNGAVQPRVDEGTKKCNKCEKLKLGKSYHHAHDSTCPKSQSYGKLQSQETKRVNKQANIYLKTNQKKIGDAEKGGSNPVAAADVQAFLERRYCQPVDNPSSTPPPSPSLKSSSINVETVPDNDATGVSNDMRFNCEIQSTACRIAAATDHTFAALKNYTSANLFCAKAIHTIGTETGELASLVIVPSRIEGGRTIERRRGDGGTTKGGRQGEDGTTKGGIATSNDEATSKLFIATGR